MSEDITSMSAKFLKNTLNELSVLRSKAMALPGQALAEAAIAAINLFEHTLPTWKHPHELIEMCGRALVDVRHELIAAEFGYESAEAEAAFDAGEQELTALICSLRQMNAA